MQAWTSRINSASSQNATKYCYMIDQLSEQTASFAGKAIGLVCISGFVAAIMMLINSPLKLEGLQHSRAIGITPALPHSSACEAWLPDLLKVKVWRGSGARCRADITVVTQLSIDRWVFFI